MMFTYCYLCCYLVCLLYQDKMNSQVLTVGVNSFSFKAPVCASGFFESMFLVHIRSDSVLSA